MKVRQGEPHGFMIEDGRFSQGFAAEDALYQMASFFCRTLKGVSVRATDTGDGDG